VLRLTETAAVAIRNMMDDAEVGPEGGLRISAEHDGETGDIGLHLAFADEAEEGDQVLEEHGVTVFLDPSAADALEDKTLDAELHGDHAHFSID
jgi:iron-sulfur cluster assembly protein